MAGIRLSSRYLTIHYKDTLLYLPAVNTPQFVLQRTHLHCQPQPLALCGASCRMRRVAIDGLVMQVSRTCKLFVPDQIAIMQSVQESTRLPEVIIEGDMVDERFFSEAKVDSAIEAFMDSLARDKRAIQGG